MDFTPLSIYTYFVISYATDAQPEFFVYTKREKRTLAGFRCTKYCRFYIPFPLPRATFYGIVDAIPNDFAERAKPRSNFR